MSKSLFMRYLMLASEYRRLAANRIGSRAVPFETRANHFLELALQQSYLYDMPMP